MPKSENQKLKLLYILKYLYEESDEQHTVTVNDIIEYLDKNGIAAARKAVYDDLRLLSEFGIDIITNKSKSNEYFIGERLFELAEIKLLVDSVQCSKSITKHKSDALIKKLGYLAGKHKAKQLNRQVFLTERIKSMNESIYYSVDAIHSAISDNKKISFRYFDYDIRNERVYRRNGKEYISNPVALTFDRGNYYLVDYSEKYGNYTHYRVDRMTNIAVLDKKRAVPDEHFDAAEYVNPMFSMYNGRLETVTAKFALHCLASVVDRFGDKMTITEVSGEHFQVRFQASVSTAFTAWIVGFGSGAKIISPQWVRDEVKALAKESFEVYD